MSRYTEIINEFFAPLSTAQRTMFVGLTLVIVTAIATLFYWTQQPDYTLLFGSLQAEPAQGIIQELDERGVQYRIENSGRSIYVESSKVDELRIQLAPMGVSQSDVKGYELFDTNSLGMTDFMQQVNKKRALEGELARSINSLDQVESTRIHLVLPERSPFRENSVEASASCILNLKQGQKLSTEQIVGMTSLIAGSVEGLETGNVTVLDQAGNRLTDEHGQNSDFASGSLQMQMRQKTESYLTERGQTMLDRVLGSGNSIIRVSVEHDFDRLIRESDLIDPESRTIISEERSNQSQSNEDRQPVAVDEFTPIDRRGEAVVVSSEDNESTTQTRNYEVNKTREVFEKTQGEIRHLSASVLLNYKQVVQQNENGEEIKISEPYSREEIEQFREVVSLALGMQPDRGDQLSLEQIQFHNPISVNEQGYVNQPTSWNNIFRWTLIGLTFIAIVFLIGSIKKRMESEQNGLLPGFPDTAVQNISIEEEQAESLESGSEKLGGKNLDADAPKQIKQKSYSLEEIKNFVELKPLEAAQVMRALMISDDN